MNSGFDIKLLSQKTGIGEAKLKKILQRHPELQEVPYSFKAGGNRVFLPAFVGWLKKYEGLCVDRDRSDNSVPSVPHLPNGSQMRELRLLVEKGIINKEHAHIMLGLSPSVTIGTQQSQPEKKTVYLPSLPTKDEQTDMLIGRRVRAKQARKFEDHKTQIRLFEDGA
ncbi:MAG: hypothetical protein KJI72_04075 [Patescibacteria group bacterium]|nr:hypothetical protein [Patescibacteria group bacterium]